jgi:hypothetical protein
MTQEQTPIPVPSETQWAWIAGVIEGEGWVDPKQPQLVVQMTDEDVVRKLHSVSSVGRFTGPKRNGKYKPTFLWGVYQRDELIYVLTAVLPWFGQRRTAEAVASIEYARTKISRRSRCVLPSALQSY